MKIKCNVYRCTKRVETYLYLRADMCPEDIPESLQHLLGPLNQFLSLDLNDSSKLAQVTASDVLDALGEQGFFLQMPPGETNQSLTPSNGYIQ